MPSNPACGVRDIYHKRHLVGQGASPKFTANRSVQVLQKGPAACRLHSICKSAVQPAARLNNQLKKTVSRRN